MTLKKLKENMISIILSLTLGFTWSYIIGLGKEQKLVNTEIEIIKLKLSNHREVIDKLEKSRENLSNYYVTRIEFNRIIEEQAKKLDRIDTKLDKIIENK